MYRPLFSLWSIFGTSPNSKRVNPRKEFFTKVPVTGFNNLYEANKTYIRRFWILTISVAAIFVVYYTSITIIKAIKDTTIIDMKIFYDENRLPFPNVSICSPIVINRTYVRETIKIPRDILKWLKKENRSSESFMDDFSNYVAFSARVKTFNLSDLKYFDRLYASNFDWTNKNMGLAVQTFYRDSQPSCQRMISDCYFENEEFDCCRNAEFRLLEDGVCYTLSRPSIDNRSAPIDRFQHRAGPKAGLTFRASMERRDASFIESDHAEGFRIHIDHVASLLNSPIAVPLGASATLHLKGRHVIRDRSCLKEITDEQTKSLKSGSFDYYDPAGIRCKEERFMDLLAGITGCRIPMFQRFSNHTIVCSPRVLYVLEIAINSDLVSEIRGIEDMKRIRNEIRSAYYNDRCLPTCSDWEYEIFASYLSMLHQSDQRSNFETDASFSRISIFYGELSHLQFMHRSATNIYTTISDIGGIACLYLGLSMTALCQLGYYGSKWIFSGKRKRKRLKKAIKNLSKKNFFSQISKGSSNLKVNFLQERD